MNWTQCPLCLGHAIDRNDSLSTGISCPKCGDINQDICTKLEQMRKAIKEAWKPLPYEDESGVLSFTLQDVAKLMEVLGVKWT